MPNIYIPIVSKFKNKRGICMPVEYERIKDAEILNCSWFYNWSSTTKIIIHSGSPQFIPMMWKGEDSGQIADKIFFLNEPDSWAQANVSPKKAVILYKNILERLKPENLIIGGVTYWKGYNWFFEFIKEIQNNDLPLPLYWHVHGYTEWGISPVQVIDFWEKCHSLTGGEYWITEFGDPDGNPKVIEDFLIWLENTSWIRGYAPFVASQVTGEETWWPESWPKPCKMNLINPDGSLTPLGKEYVKWQK